MSVDTYYFCLKLTENEHYIIHSKLVEFCATCNNLRVMYYRTLKDGHIPMIREVKVQGSPSSIKHFERWLKTYPKPSKALINDIVRNPYTVERKNFVNS